MSLTERFENISREAHHAVDEVKHAVEPVINHAFEHDPMHKEVELLQKVIENVKHIDSAMLRMQAEEMNARLHQCGILPGVFIAPDVRPGGLSIDINVPVWPPVPGSGCFDYQKDIHTIKPEIHFIGSPADAGNGVGSDSGK